MNILALLATLLVSANLQDPPAPSKDEVKKALMEKVKKRLEEERTRILERVAKTLDDELAKAGGGMSLADRLSQIEKQSEVAIRTLEAQLAGIKAEVGYWKADAALIEDALKTGPKNPAQIDAMFKRAFTMIDKDAQYAEAADLFKKIYYVVTLGEVKGASAETSAVISAYNAACAYSRLNERDKALDWLAISFGKGFMAAHGVRDCSYDPAPHNSVAHAEHDPDLENVRDEPRFKEILKPFSE